MLLKVGDKVRIDTGDEGKIVSLQLSGESALVQLHQPNKPGTGMRPVPLALVTRIEEYTPTPAEPPA